MLGGCGHHRSPDLYAARGRGSTDHQVFDVKADPLVVIAIYLAAVVIGMVSYISNLEKLT